MVLYFVYHVFEYNFLPIWLGRNQPLLLYHLLLLMWMKTKKLITIEKVKIQMPNIHLKEFPYQIFLIVCSLFVHYFFAFSCYLLITNILQCISAQSVLINNSAEARNKRKAVVNEKRKHPLTHIQNIRSDDSQRTNQSHIHDEFHTPLRNVRSRLLSNGMLSYHINYFKFYNISY